MGCTNYLAAEGAVSQRCPAHLKPELIFKLGYPFACLILCMQFRTDRMSNKCNMCVLMLEPFPALFQAYCLCSFTLIPDLPLSSDLAQLIPET